MKLIGYYEIKGANSNGSYDFYQLVIDREEKPTDHSGGVQLLMRRRNSNYTLPSISSEAWNAALRAGVRLGSSIDLSYSADGKARLSLVQDSPFQDVV